MYTASGTSNAPSAIPPQTSQPRLMRLGDFGLASVMACNFRMAHCHKFHGSWANKSDRARHRARGPKTSLIDRDSNRSVALRYASN
jgi:hypothetical protein